ncbi:MAG: hypothetical protein B6D61_11455, partial [Bacteroidetes bacterium 4484_249]
MIWSGNEKILFFVFAVMMANNVFAQPENDPFVFEPSYTNLGTITDGDNVEISFDLIYVLSSYNEYYLDIDQINFELPWITTINPDEVFGLSYYGDGRTITLSGEFENPSGYYGLNIYYLDFYENVWPYNWVMAYEIRWESIPSFGIEDNIDFYSFITDFNEFDMLNYIVLFIDEEPYGDYITDWNLKIVLYTNNEEYIYVDIDQDCCGTEAGWQFTAPELPQNITFNRNESGQIYGQVEVTGIDNDLFEHKTFLEIGINKEPDKPILHTIPEPDNSVQLYLSNSGGVNNYIY